MIELDTQDDMSMTATEVEELSKKSAPILAMPLSKEKDFWYHDKSKLYILNANGYAKIRLLFNISVLDIKHGKVEIDGELPKFYVQVKGERKFDNNQTLQAIATKTLDMDAKKKSIVIQADYLAKKKKWGEKEKQYYIDKEITRLQMFAVESVESGALNRLTKILAGMGNIMSTGERDNMESEFKDVQESIDEKSKLRLPQTTKEDRDNGKALAGIFITGKELGLSAENVKKWIYITHKVKSTTHLGNKQIKEVEKELLACKKQPEKLQGIIALINQKETK